MPEYVGAEVSPRAQLEENVRVGPGSVVYENVRIGRDTTIGEHCVIGVPAKGAPPLTIGAGSTVRSHTVMYQGAELGAKFESGHHAIVRSGVHAGKNLRLGSYSSLEGDLDIGDFVRIHGYSQVGQGSEIGSFVWIFSLCTLTNDPLPPSNLSRPVVIEDGGVVCVGVILMPGARVGKGALVAAGARVSGDLPAGRVMTADGEVAGRVDRLVDLETGARHPFMRHYASAYPAEAQQGLLELLEEIATL